MKDSGIEWIGEMPIDWELRRGKYLLREKKEKSETGLGEPLSMSQKLGLVPTTVLGSIPHGASSFVGARLVKPNDLVFNKLKAHLGVFSVSKYRGLVSPDYAVYRALPIADVRFLEYVFKTPGCIAEFTKRATGVGQGLTRLYTSQLFDIKYPYPCVSEQHRIADYLDERCAAIDEVRRTIEDEIEALRRLRKATIHRAVTKGLDEGVPMRDSGVEWIGEMPEGWHIVPLKSVCAFGKGVQYNKADMVDEGFPILGYGQVHSKLNNGTHYPEGLERYAKPEIAAANRQAIAGKDCLLFAATSEDAESLGNCILIDVDTEVLAGTDTVIVRGIFSCIPKYLAYMFRTDCWRDQFRRDAIEVKVYHLSATKLRRTSILLPPLSEQQRIADYLDERCAAIDSIIDTRTQQLQRLDDYRRALVFAYVTGKKEVPSHE